MTQFLHKLTQWGYIVSFHEDFDGMVRIEFTKEDDDTFYEHFHVSFPGDSMAQLEEAINKCLVGFIDDHNEE